MKPSLLSHQTFKEELIQTCHIVKESQESNPHRHSLHINTKWYLKRVRTSALEIQSQTWKVQEVRKCKGSEIVKLKEGENGNKEATFSPVMNILIKRKYFLRRSEAQKSQMRCLAIKKLPSFQSIIHSQINGVLNAEGAGSQTCWLIGMSWGSFKKKFKE